MDRQNRAIGVAESRLARVAPRLESLAFVSAHISPQNTETVLIDPAFVVVRFESCDWRLFLQHSFHVELRNGLRELTAFAEHLAIGNWRFCPF